MLPATIATSVAPETITKVSRLFNGSVIDILQELLQNARRAGARSIAISITGQPGDRHLHVIDDGHGISDPASIVTLGRSDWGEDTQRREDPAGMGVFSLAGYEIIIRSWSRSEQQGWCAHIPAAAWESSQVVAVSPDPIVRGTAITVRMPCEWENEVCAAVRSAARYYPLPVTFDGAAVEQEGWLDDAIHVEDWNGCRIGVVRENTRALRDRRRLNFHGVTIPCETPEVREVGRGEYWAVRIDIVDCPEIQLVLPARKEAVQNAALCALQVAAKAAIYRAIGKAGSHRLAHTAWLEAREMGIDLPEAEAYLYGWLPAHADSYRNEMRGEKTTGDTMVIMEDFDAIVAQPAWRAISRHRPFAGPLVCVERAFAGYHWYDDLACVETIAFIVEQDGRTFRIEEDGNAPEDAKDGFADSLTLVATVAQAGATTTLSCEADVAFAPDCHLSVDPDDLAIFLRRGAELVSPDIIDLLQDAAFAPDSDSDADSYRTQQVRFQRDAADRVVGLLEGSDAALDHRMRSLLRNNSWMVPADRAVTITMTRDQIDVTIVELTPLAA